MKYFLKCMNWMLDVKDDVVVPAKTYESVTLNITEIQTTIMNWLLVIILPLLILGTGLFVYLRRRHL
jgi:LPXTG-motif cell wall-anchored protein